MKKIVLFITLGSSIFLSTLSAKETWDKTFGGDRYENGIYLLECSDSNYVILGSSASFEADDWNIWLLKVNQEGDTLWTKTFGSSEDSTREYASCIEETSDSGFIIVGSTNLYGYGEGDILLLKTDKSGDTAWTRKYTRGDGAGGSFVSQTGDGGFIIVGIYHVTDQEDEDEDYIWILKTDSTGDTISTRSYRGDDFYNLLGVCKSHHTGFVIFAGLAGYDENCFIHIDEDGEELKVKEFFSWFIDVYHAHDIQKGHDGYVITGAAYTSDPHKGPGLWVSFIEPVYFEEEWSDVIWDEDDGPAAGSQIQPTLDGGYILVASPWTLYKFGSWKRDYEIIPYFVLPTSDSGYLLTGHKDEDLSLIKTDSLGNLAIEEPSTFDIKPGWQITTPIGRTVTLRAVDGSEPIDLAVFDISGQKVDELSLNLTNNTLTWGTGFAPGVYFIRQVSGEYPLTQKVILIK